MLQCSKKAAYGENWHQSLPFILGEASERLVRQIHRLTRSKGAATNHSTGNPHFIIREFTQSLPYASPQTEFITAGCKASLITILGQPRDRPPVFSLTDIPLGKAPGICGASHDAIPWSRLCPPWLPGQLLHMATALQGVMQKSHWVSHDILTKEGYEILVYMISSKSPNVSANEGKSYLQKWEQHPGAGSISELLKALKLQGQKHSEEAGTTGQQTF